MLSRWQPLEWSDLDRVDAIQHIIHADLPEHLDFLAEKLELFPEGCRKLVRHGEMIGYALAHRWTLGRVPALNASLRPLPADPDCLHMHDVAILPEGRGANAAGTYVDHLRALAKRDGIGSLACVSVYGTTRLWRRHGFEAADRPLSGSLASYGPDAVYMTARLTASE